jgi:hypothetical protein
MKAYGTVEKKLQSFRNLGNVRVWNRRGTIRSLDRVFRSLGMRTAQTANTLTGETYRKGEVVAVHAMKAYGRVEKKLQSFRNLGNVGVSGQLQAPAVLPSGKVSPLAIIQEIVGLAAEPVWMLHTRKTCCSCQVLPLAHRA